MAVEAFTTLALAALATLAIAVALATAAALALGRPLGLVGTVVGGSVLAVAVVALKIGERGNKTVGSMRRGCHLLGPRGSALTRLTVAAALALLLGALLLRGVVLLGLLGLGLLGWSRLKEGTPPIRGSQAVSEGIVARFTMEAIIANPKPGVLPPTVPGRRRIRDFTFGAFSSSSSSNNAKRLAFTPPGAGILLK